MGKYSGLSDQQINSKLSNAQGLTHSGWTAFGVGVGFLVAGSKECSFLALGIIGAVLGLGMGIGFNIKYDDLLKEKEFRLTLTKQ